MKRFFCAAAVAVACLAGSNAHAGITFNTDITVNFNAVDGTLSSVSDVRALDFGSTNTGRIAVNTTDNGDGFFGVGDTTRVVGHADINSFLNAGSGLEEDLIAAGGSGFQLNGVLVDVDTVVTTVGGPIPVIAPNGFASTAVTAGFLDLWVDLGPATPFDIGNVATSADSVRVARFEIVQGGQFIPFLSPNSTSTFDFKLIEMLGDSTPGDTSDDFFQLASGADPFGPDVFLATQVLSTDRRIPESLTGIFGGSDPVDIGSNFNPLTGPFPDLTNGDFFASVDGDARFGVIPEPGSMLAFAGIGIAGLRFRRRRRKA